MAEELIIQNGLSREEQYEQLLPQLRALVSDEENEIANMANIAAALRETFNFFWVGFYIVDGSELVLGPFQGPIACTRIAKGKGVCGSAWATGKTYIVPDVDAFPGHIACNGASKSEIVVPGIDSAKSVKFVLDIDSDQLNDFDSTDQKYLEHVVRLLV